MSNEPFFQATKGAIFYVEPKSCFHAGDFVARRGAIASICAKPAARYNAEPVTSFKVEKDFVL